MAWKTAVALTLVGIAPVSAQRAHGRHEVRVEIPPIVVDVPRTKVDIPAINVAVPPVMVNLPRVHVDDPNIKVDIPSIRFDMPTVRVDVPAMNFDFPGFHLDLSSVSEAVEAAVRDVVDAVGDIEVHAARSDSQVDQARVHRLMREWRKAVRAADETGNWDDADELARQLTRAADRLNPNSLHGHRCCSIER